MAKTKAKAQTEKMDWEKVFKNFLIFNLFPFLSIFFGQLALKVDWKTALAISSLTLYSTLADTCKKWANKK